MDPRVNSLPGIGPRTREVAALLVLGMTDKQIGLRIKMAPGTVKYHVGRILAATGSDNRTMAAVALTRSA